ncbi:hypothetical protein L345_16155, partial [Ophiophagus hannah]
MRSAIQVTDEKRRKDNHSAAMIVIPVQTGRFQTRRTPMNKYRILPVALCNEKCHPGYRRKKKEGEPFCCYNCVPCPDGKISDQKDYNNYLKKLAGAKGGRREMGSCAGAMLEAKGHHGDGISEDEKPDKFFTRFDMICLTCCTLEVLL